MHLEIVVVFLSLCLICTGIVTFKLFRTVFIQKITKCAMHVSVVKTKQNMRQWYSFFVIEQVEAPI